jgi:hypothetical protein
MIRALALTLVLSLAGAACDVNAQDIATIALDLNGPRPTAQLQIGDTEPVTAIFDTGAAASVLKLGYAQRLGLPDEGQAAAHGPGDAPVQGFRTTIRNGRLGDAAFDDAIAVAFDIQLPLEGVDAIISPGVFAGRYVRFDFTRGIAYVLPRTPQNRPVGEGTPYRGETAHGRITQTPGVELQLPNVATVMAVVDTGSARGLTLPLDLASRLPMAGELAPRDPIRLVGVEHRAFTGRIAGVVRVGPLTLENVEANFGDGIEESIVGMEILRNTEIVLDPQARRSWLLAPSR